MSSFFQMRDFCSSLKIPLWMSDWWLKFPEELGPRCPVSPSPLQFTTPCWPDSRAPILHQLFMYVGLGPKPPKSGWFLSPGLRLELEYLTPVCLAGSWVSRWGDLHRRLAGSVVPAISGVSPRMMCPWPLPCSPKCSCVVSPCSCDDYP